MKRFSWLGTLPLGLLVVVFGAALGPAARYPESPPAAHTGGFGEPTCQRCHFDQPLNAPEGALTLEGVPDVYTAGERYRLRVRLVKPDLQKAGFQVAVRFSEGPAGGKQAGVLTAIGSRAEVVVFDSTAVQYIQHTEEGTTPTAEGTASWDIAWTAPDTVEAPITVHLVANAANDDASEFGDYIYAVEEVSVGGKKANGK